MKLMNKLFISLSLLINSLFSVAQIEEIKTLSKQNMKFIHFYGDLEIPVEKVQFRTHDTILAKEIHFSISYNGDYDKVEVDRGREDVELNYFRYDKRKLSIVGCRSYEGDYFGNWYYLSDRYFLKVFYTPEKVLTVDTVFHSEDPSIIIYIDTIYTNDIIFPVIRYDLETGKEIDRLTKKKIKRGSLKEEEIDKNLLIALKASVSK